MWGGVQAGQGQAQTRGREESPAPGTHCAGISQHFRLFLPALSSSLRSQHLHFTDEKTEARGVARLVTELGLDQSQLVCQSPPLQCLWALPP